MLDGDDTVAYNKFQDIRLKAFNEDDLNICESMKETPKTNVNTEQWDENFVVLNQSRLAKLHRRFIFKLSKFDSLVTDKDSRILDVGCGSGMFLTFLWQSGFKNLYGVEPDAELVNQIHPTIRPRIKISKAEAIDFEDSSFDVVFVYGVLHHLKDIDAYETSCKEIIRVLKPGGKVFVMEPGRYYVFRAMEIAAKPLGVFSKTFKALSECLEEEEKEQHYFLKNHNVVRDRLKQGGLEAIVDEYFLYTWIFTARKPI